MKREIKFRGKRQDNGEWVVGFYFTTPLTDGNSLIDASCGWYFLSDGTKRHCISTNNGVVYVVNPETVGQFTGLVDKNGKEIYEGDIIGFKYCCWHRRWWSKQTDIPIINKECEDQRSNVIHQRSLVRFDDGMFVLDYPVTLKDFKFGKLTKTSETNNGEATSEYWDFETIGNIYDNPELIK